MWNVPILGFGPAAIGLVCLAMLWSRRRSIRGTTLVGPSWWLLATTASIVLVSLAEPILGKAGMPEVLNYLTAMATFCPLMALLGARRPQDQGWVFVVATFWLILALPGLQVWLTRPGQAIDPAAARGLLMLALLGVTAVCLVPTPIRLAGMAVVFGQWVLIAPWITFGGYEFPDAAYWGRTICGLGLLACLLQPRRNHQAATRFAYRDHFGGLWALRIAERFNAFANSPSTDQEEQSSDSKTLRMRGLYGPDGLPAGDDEVTDEQWRAFRNLLRRFVSDDWVKTQEEVRID